MLACYEARSPGHELYCQLTALGDPCPPGHRSGREAAELVRLFPADADGGSVLPDLQQNRQAGPFTPIRIGTASKPSA